MRKLQFVIGMYMLIVGVALGADLLMVLMGYTIPVSYPEYGMKWENSPIFHYNVSTMANVIIGYIVFMALFAGFFTLRLMRKAKNKTIVCNHNLN